MRLNGMGQDRAGGLAWAGVSMVGLALGCDGIPRSWYMLRSFQDATCRDTCCYVLLVDTGYCPADTRVQAIVLRESESKWSMWKWSTCKWSTWKWSPLGRASQ